MYACMSWQQTIHWRDNLVLYEWTAQHAPHSGKAFYNLGCAYLEHGRTNDAREAFRKALAINSNIVEAKTALERLNP